MRGITRASDAEERSTSISRLSHKGAVSCCRSRELSFNALEKTRDTSLEKGFKNSQFSPKGFLPVISHGNLDRKKNIMNLNKQIISQISCRKKLLVGLSSLIIAQTGLGVVTAHFEQAGPDVRVSWSGTLTVDPILFDSLTSFSSNTIASLVTFDELVGGNSPATYSDGVFFTGAVGFASNSGLNTNMGSATNSNGRVFGYFLGGTTFNYDSAQITGGVLGAVSELTVDPTLDFFLLENRALSSVVGSTTEGDVLWTAATTGDTIIFSTLPSGAVPEPSAALLLCSVASLFSLTWRRRQK